MEDSVVISKIREYVHTRDVQGYGSFIDSLLGALGDRDHTQRVASDVDKLEYLQKQIARERNVDRKNNYNKEVKEIKLRLDVPKWYNTFSLYKVAYMLFLNLITFEQVETFLKEYLDILEVEPIRKDAVLIHNDDTKSFIIMLDYLTLVFKETDFPLGPSEEYLLRVNISPSCDLGYVAATFTGDKEKILQGALAYVSDLRDKCCSDEDIDELLEGQLLSDVENYCFIKSFSLHKVKT